jgi:magnesium-transporting ATPase (P-type)
MKIKHRSPVAVIILFLLTFGIYAVYWTFKTRDEINSLGASIPTAWLIFVPIANFYFMYCYSEGFSLFVKKDNSAILWFLLFFFVSPVAVILVQIELNKLAAPGGIAVPQAS